MVYRNALRAIILATSCLTPAYAFADQLTPSVGDNQYIYQGEFEFGVMGVVGTNSDQAGRYDGITTTGIDPLGQFNFTGRPAPDTNGTWYYSATGTNLILQTGTGLGGAASGDSNYISSTNNNLFNNGSVDLNFGQQGTWEGGLRYDAISYTGNVIDSIYTMNGNLGVLNNGFPAWGGATVGAPGTTAYTVSQLSTAMKPVQTGTRRDIFGGDFKYIDGDWTFTGAMTHEHKTGSMEESLDLKYGGTAFALPIDYTTDRYDAGVAYNTRVNQVSLQYTFSNFHDNNLFVNLPQVVSMATVPYQESAAYSTPPSNSAHYLTLLAATNAVPNTRVNFNARVGLELQGDTFAPDTADPNPGTAPGGLGGLNSQLQGTSSNTLDAMATVVQGKLSVTSHPIVNTDASAFYGLDSRSVSLNQNKVYTGTTGGSGDAGWTSASYVVPQEWFKQNAGFEVGYRIIPEFDTKVTAGFRYDEVDRSNSQVGHSDSYAETLALSSRLGSQINERLSYEHADRSGVLNYIEPWANLAGSNSGVTYSGAYYQAPMTSDAVKLMSNYAPLEYLSGDLFLQFKNENYNYPSINPANSGGATTGYPLTGQGEGIKSDYNLSVGPDVNYRPLDNLELHLFYTYERIFFNNFGNGNCATSNTGTCLGSAGYYQNKYTSSVNTIGTSGDWKITDKLKLKAEYTFAYGSVMFGEYNGVYVGTPTASYQNVTAYPDIDSVMHNFKLTGIYAATEKMELILQGTFTYYRDSNWADTAAPVQGAGTTTPSYLTPGYSSPNYSIATLMTGVRYKF